jgi:DNA polymerase
VSTRSSVSRASLARVRRDAGGCRDCELWAPATQTVFGEGSPRARFMLVGEQPGDREDREGRPFVGPAGLVLEGALEEAGIARADAYVTNVVKHFKFRERGKRRIHQRPAAGEIRACRKWLDAELELVAPEMLICLGLTAGRALLGPRVTIGEHRGRVLESELAPLALLTAHPSSVLRERDSEARDRAQTALVRDLRVAATALVSDSG